MRIWLDDERPPPDETWTWARNAEDFREWFADYSATITEISFDHDIASFDYFGNEVTGYDMLCMIEKRAMTDSTYVIPKIRIHTS